VKIAADWTVALLFPRDLAQLGSFENPREPFVRAARATPSGPMGTETPTGAPNATGRRG
jgi:hypothetical protein